LGSIGKEKTAEDTRRGNEGISWQGGKKKKKGADKKRTRTGRVSNGKEKKKVGRKRGQQSISEEIFQKCGKGGGEEIKWGESAHKKKRRKAAAGILPRFWGRRKMAKRWIGRK